MKQLIFLLSVLGMFSCTRNVGLERTFQRAGENRSELEKVLRHYEDDDRKYRAVLFLLERMADVARGRGLAIIDGAAEGNDEGEQRCDGTEHHREELSGIG